MQLLSWLIGVWHCTEGIAASENDILGKKKKRNDTIALAISYFGFQNRLKMGITQY